MSKCGECKFFKFGLRIDHKTQALGVDVGTCEREKWPGYFYPIPKEEGIDWDIFGGWATIKYMHYRHLLSTNHPAPPCFKSTVVWDSCPTCGHRVKRGESTIHECVKPPKRVTTYGGVQSAMLCVEKGKTVLKGRAITDIQMGEEVIIE